MRTELVTVSKIFTESLYRIPDYQRGYSWGVDQLRDFWLDLDQLATDAKHYTGVLTLEEVPGEKWKEWYEDLWIINSRKYKPYYVVDGQQRLTTVIILIQTILEARRPAHLNFTRADDVRRKYIFDSKPEDSARSYIFGYEKDNPSYEFLKKRIFREASDHHLADEVTIYTKNLLAAKKFFEDKVSAMDDLSIEKLFSRLTQQLVFNVYEISEDIDVFVTFETMNNRGKPLTTLELLKNRLIFLSTKIPTPPDREVVLRRAVNEAWKSAYHYLGKNDSRPLDDDEFLRTHLAHYYISKLAKFDVDDEDEQIRVRRKFEVRMENFSRFLLTELFTPKRMVSDDDSGSDCPALSRDFIFEFSQQLKACVETYYKLSTPSESQYSGQEKVWLERIGRLDGYSPNSLLVALYNHEEKSVMRAKVLEKIERYYFLNSLGLRGAYLSGRRRFMGPDYLIKFVTGKLSTDELLTLFENFANEVIKDNPIHEVLNESIRGGAGYYGWRAVRYFLYEYELALQSRARSKREKIKWSEFVRDDFSDEYETIEHIYPQRARDPYWTKRFSEFSSSQKRALRNSLGNLLALARPRNSSLGNRPFPEKVGAGASQSGYRFGSYSENEVSMVPEWNAQSILERGIVLMEFLEQRWKVTIGDRAQKAKALGLGFLL